MPVNPVGIGMYPPAIQDPAIPQVTAASISSLLPSALNLGGLAPLHKQTILVDDAAIRANTGAGAITIVGTIAAVSSFCIVPAFIIQQRNFTTAYSTPGATTPGIRYQNTDVIGAYFTWTSLANTAPKESMLIFSPMSTLNISFDTWTPAQRAFGQAVEIIHTNAGAQWTAGSAANFFRYTVCYFLIDTSGGFA